MKNQLYDVVIVGCGLAGLTAGLHLAKNKRKVLILEKRNAPGGLCGTFILDGYEFVIACNDFGQGFKRELKQLGVDIIFNQYSSRFYFGNFNCYKIPPNLSTLLRLFPQLPGLIKLIKKGRNGRYNYLGELLENTKVSSLVKDMACLFAYGSGQSPYDMRLNAFTDEFSKEYQYGYNKMQTPAGGTQHLANQMLKKFLDTGGAVLFDHTCQTVISEENNKTVITPSGNFSAKKVITSQGRWDHYPAYFKSGLSIGIFLIALTKNFSYPKKVHTICYLPKNTLQWMKELDQGKLVSEFGFHLFRSDLPDKTNYQTVNLYFYLPRNENSISKEYISKSESYIFSQVEKLLPGFNKEILFKKFISPEEFKQIHGLSGTPTRKIIPFDSKKPDIYNSVEDIYYIGNSVYPPGEHAGAAILSGKMAAQAVEKDLIAI